MRIHDVCSRNGCGKKLRAQNKSGKCASGCLSPDASPAVRAKTLDPFKMSPPKKTPAETLANFRTVCTAMGKDPDELLAQAAEAWLLAVREAVAKLDSEAVV